MFWESVSLETLPGAYPLTIPFYCFSSVLLWNKQQGTERKRMKKKKNNFVESLVLTFADAFNSSRGKSYLGGLNMKIHQGF